MPSFAGLAVSYAFLAAFFIFLYCAIYWIVVFFEETASAKRKPNVPDRNLPKVTVLIPAYNASSTIERAIDSCLSLDYPKEKLRIIVVDDGSSDETPEILAQVSKKSPRVKFIRKKNTGKSDSLNRAIFGGLVKTPFVSCLDADSFFHPHAMRALVAEVSVDENVAAVASSIKVAYPKTGIERIQRLEYFFSIYLRRLMGRINAIYVVPGPGSLYRTSALKKSGGFDKDNLTEDMEIAFRLRAMGFGIGNAPDADVETIAPKSLYSLTRQRTRWYAGYFQNIEKYSKFILNPAFSELGLFIIPINFALLVAMLFILSNSAYEILSNFSDVARRIFLGGFDAFIPRFPDIFGLAFSANLLSVFSIIFFILGCFVIYASFKLSKETFFGKGGNITDFVLYTLFYFPMVSAFYLISLVYYGAIRLKGAKLKWQGASFHQ